LFEDAIRKYNLLDVSEYINTKEYNEAITKLASKIEIITTTIPSGDENVPSQSFTNIEFLYYDSEKWKNVLKYVHENANEVVQQKLRNYLENLLTILTKKQNEKLEDLEITIRNLISDYDRETSDQILYLIEQSEIAKKLGISKNTIEVQTFGSQTLFSSVNTDTDSPFYLRGYEAIDKEISLMTSRINKRAFIKGLYSVEKEVRQIKQSKSLKRIASSISSSPLAENQDFSAGTIKFLTTEFKYKNKKNILLITGLFSSIIGLILVLFSNLFKSQKIVKKY
jgi:DNA-binding CsgD family transcriptional regulator